MKTPHFDRIASGSLLYTRGYTTPVCSPSLACLLTGKLPRQNGMTGTQGRHGGDGMKPIDDFIEVARKKEKPFFIWHVPLMPHDPQTPPANDLAKNTAVLYLSGNGWNASEGYKGGRAKLNPYETGIRSPMSVRWPDRVKPLRDDEALASIIGFAPTILKMAGIGVPPDLTGKDLLDHAAMTARKSIFAEAYTHDIKDLQKPASSLMARVVIDDWSKLIIPGSARSNRPFATVPEKIEFFDLKKDPLEHSDLAAKRPEEVERLLAIQNAAWKAE